MANRVRQNRQTGRNEAEPIGGNWLSNLVNSLERLAIRYRRRRRPSMPSPHAKSRAGPPPFSLGGPPPPRPATVRRYSTRPEDPKDPVPSSIVQADPWRRVTPEDRRSSSRVPREAESLASPSEGRASPMQTGLTARTRVAHAKAIALRKRRPANQTRKHLGLASEARTESPMAWQRGEEAPPIVSRQEAAQFPMP